MTHNDVARRTAPEMPARRVIPRTPACDHPVPFVEVAQRAIVRALPLRALHRDGRGGR
ncbi:hypothetical protein ATKI12_2042 [Kitasatospora sp. Ki12]|uniref:hypothetical protein n=1 Tax=Kitasatospora xanthocidica TaxID=83382 RepID=UPI00167BFD7E|nr:hypothetical protein [Kitasatospora xanthocidica]GHF27638.1 hypothetical protein GCM10018790_01180 [Kitasatospora xanthocidica]